MGACWIIIAACGAISKTKSLNQHSRNEIRAKGCFKKKLLTKKGILICDLFFYVSFFKFVDNTKFYKIL